MILNQELSSYFEKFLKETNNERTNGSINCVQFIKNGGIRVKMPNCCVTLNLPEVDITGAVEGPYIISALVSELKKGNVEIKNNNGTIEFCNYYFAVSNSFNIPSVNEVSGADPELQFTTEQWKKLEKDFYLTAGNYFISSKATDVIGFAMIEGTVKEIVPGGVRKIANFDVLKDDVQLERNFGHTRRIYLLPKKVYDFVEGDKISLKFNGNSDSVCIYSNKVIVEYNFVDFGLKLLDLLDVGTINTQISLGELKHCIPDIPQPENEEDMLVEISFHEDNTTASINNLSWKSEGRAETNFQKLSLNYQIIKYLIGILPESATLYKTNNLDYYVVKNGEESYFILTND